MNWQQDLTPIDMDGDSESYQSMHNNNDDDDDSFANSVADEHVLQMKSEYCQKTYANLTENMISSYGDGGFCHGIFDGALCWPPTPANQTAIVKCFAEFKGLKYDDTQNATRFCMLNGTWFRSYYDNCHEILPYTEEDIDTKATIYFAGYTISMITLSIAIGIFTYFKELRCLRNTIHMNLMWSYILMYCMWIVMHITFNFDIDTTITCIFLVVLLHYFHIATFFWMFVEGLYLYILVVETLTRENFKLRVYVAIGWGLPMVFIVIWAVAKGIIPVKRDSTSSPCVWFEPHNIDYIFQVPTLIVLVLNLMFLCAIMYVLITKLRSANTVETQQYHKAAKALIVLMPLLGVTYILTMYGPTSNALSKNVFEFVRALLLSTQGFTVAMFYCFLNTEVQNAMRHHFETWKARRSLGPSRLRSGSRSKDWSPRSRTESLRITDWTLVETDDTEADRKHNPLSNGLIH